MRLDPNAIKQQISNLLLQWPELAEDEVLRADMIEGETEAFDFLRMIERQRQDAASMAGAIASNIAELGLRQERFERREKAMRQLAQKIMESANLPKITLPEATYSIGKPRDRTVINGPIENVPADYCHPPVPKPDMKRIAEALKAGERFNWASLVTGEPSLTIRTK